MKLTTRPFIRVLVSVAVLALLLISPSQKINAERTSIPGPQVNPAKTPGMAFLPGEVIVKMKFNRSAQSLRNLKSARYLASKQAPFGYSLVEIEGDVRLACQELQSNPDVISAEPNYIRYLSIIPNDPRWPQQRNMNLSNAPSGWDIETGDAKVIVAVIDTGVDYHHPELQPNLLPGKNFREVGDEMDDSGHGTAVCGVIGAVGNNSNGIAGAAWNIKILPIRACGGEDLKCNVIDTVEAIEEAISQGADIINLSLGGANASSIERDAINTAWNAGIVMFAAVGNEGKLGKFGDSELEQYITYPAGYENVCGVSSVDYPTAGNLTQIHLSNFSNSGDAVSVTAVGSQVVTTIPVVDVQYPIFGSKKDYASVGGTSFSTPLVSGIAALVKSHFPEMNNSEIRDQIQSAVWDIGDTGWDNEFGWGLVDFQKALVGGTHASNDAFNLGITASPILPDDIILIVKAKIAMTNIPVVYYLISDIHGIIDSGTIGIKAIPGDGTIFSGRLHTERSGAMNFTVCGTSVSGPLPDLYLEYFKKDF